MGPVTSNTSPQRLDASTRRRVMALGDLDERTVINWERGLPVRPSSDARIRAALDKVRAQGRNADVRRSPSTL